LSPAGTQMSRLYGSTLIGFKPPRDVLFYFSCTSSPVFWKTAIAGKGLF